MSTTQQDVSTTDAAKDEAKHVAGVASDEAQNVAQEAKAQARGLLDDARTQIDEQSRTQLGNLQDLLTRIGDDLQQMAQSSDQGGFAVDAARAVSERAKGLSNHLDGREPADLLDDVRDFARRRPGTFLLGALAAGVVAGRFARGAKADSSSTGASGSVSKPDSAAVPAQPSTVTGPGSGVDPVTGERVVPPSGVADAPAVDPSASPIHDDLSAAPIGERSSASYSSHQDGLR